MIGLPIASEVSLVPSIPVDARDPLPANARALLDRLRLGSGRRYSLWRQMPRPDGRGIVAEVLVEDLRVLRLGKAQGIPRAWPVESIVMAVEEPAASGPSVLVFTERVFYGSPPLEFPLSLSRSFLERARPEGGVFRPAPDDELLGLLLECILEVRAFEPAHRRRIEALLGWPDLIDDFHVSRLLDEALLIPGLWEHIQGCLFAEDYGALLALAAPIHAARQAGRSV